MTTFAINDDARRPVMSGDAIVAFTTVGTMDAAMSLADALVKRRLAACVQIVPGVKSVYRWSGDVQHDDEIQLVIKSVASNVDALIETFRAEHPYELPELVTLRIDGGLPGYLEWVATESSGRVG